MINSEEPAECFPEWAKNKGKRGGARERIPHRHHSWFCSFLQETFLTKGPNLSPTNTPPELSIMKIPGLAHEVHVRIESGVHLMDLTLRGDVIATSPLKSVAESGIRAGLLDVAKKAEISHQIPESIIGDLAKRLSKEAGYIGGPAGEAAGGKPGEIGGQTVIFGEEIQGKLDAILEKLAAIDKRLDKFEERWG